jgi:hypothetical protein
MDQIRTRDVEGDREQYGWWRGVRVTDAIMAVGDVAYDVGQLSWLRVERGRAPAVRAVVLSVVATETTIVGLAAARLVQLNEPTMLVCLIGLVQILFTVGMVAFAVLRWPRPRQLWAVYRDEPTMLYTNADRYEFGKVHRAVRRAMLSHRNVK